MPSLITKRDIWQIKWHAFFYCTIKKQAPQKSTLELKGYYLPETHYIFYIDIWKKIKQTLYYESKFKNQTQWFVLSPTLKTQRFFNDLVFFLSKYIHIITYILAANTASI